MKYIFTRPRLNIAFSLQVYTNVTMEQLEVERSYPGGRTYQGLANEY